MTVQKEKSPFDVFLFFFFNIASPLTFYLSDIYSLNIGYTPGIAFRQIRAFFRMYVSKGKIKGISL